MAEMSVYMTGVRSIKIGPFVLHSMPSIVQKMIMQCRYSHRKGDKARKAKKKKKKRKVFPVIFNAITQHAFLVISS